MFDGIFEDGVTIQNLFLTWGISLACGLIVAFAYRIKNKNYSKNLLVSLILFPLITQSVVMLVNRGDAAMIGVGVAIAGVFSLVRFRSISGNSREISFVFLAMAIGVALGVGQIWFALIFTGVASVIFIAFKFIPLDRIKGIRCDLKITAPEDLEFDKEFDEILKKYSTNLNLVSVKTEKMGSLYEIKYLITLKSASQIKAMVDELRVKNSNLPIICRHLVVEEVDKL